jgi:hypothetical protein
LIDRTHDLVASLGGEIAIEKLGSQIACEASPDLISGQRRW